MVSTLESRNSITSFRECRTRSVSVFTFISGSTRREHAGARTRDPLDLDHAHAAAFTGVRLSA